MSYPTIKTATIKKHMGIESSQVQLFTMLYADGTLCRLSVNIETFKRDRWGFFTETKSNRTYSITPEQYVELLEHNGGVFANSWNHREVGGFDNVSELTSINLIKHGVHLGDPEFFCREVSEMIREMAKEA